ncbi:hypothetical protein [Vibrio parahaemolyticus]|uniref:hypothetical protein n=1 Tax=Vibrio parahaemolyticus TaxID=670 RepID=UPI00215CD9A7|nr:hypothetical protein [Vibrio parahaemolyticus]MCR9671139.1 hypothetical protein [Vibrio parahaemolyticus]MCR9826734.1 hypothetical protein [Vibrio parahaemolyticus]
MSEASKTTAKKTSSAKSTAKTDSKTVGASTAPEPTQTKQDALTEEDKAKQEAEAKAKAEAEKQALLEAEAQAKAKAESERTANVLGAFIASAKSEQGFWRAGVKFARNKRTLLVVCEFDGEPIEADMDGIKHDEVIYIGTEKAARIHREPNLVIEDVEL